MFILQYLLNTSIFVIFLLLYGAQNYQLYSIFSMLFSSIVFMCISLLQANNIEKKTEENNLPLLSMIFLPFETSKILNIEKTKLIKPASIFIIYIILTIINSIYVASLYEIPIGANIQDQLHQFLPFIFTGSLIIGILGGFIFQTILTWLLLVIFIGNDVSYKNVIKYSFLSYSANLIGTFLFFYYNVFFLKQNPFQGELLLVPIVILKSADFLSLALLSSFLYFNESISKIKSLTISFLPSLLISALQQYMLY